MFDMSEISEKEKVAILTTIFNQANSEIIRYRDLEWKVTAWIVAIQVGVISSLTALPLNRYVLPNVARLLYCGFIFIVAAYGIWHIIHVHRQLTKERKIRKKLEHVLGFYTEGLYTKDTLLPVEWGHGETPFWRGREHLFSFWFLILVVSTFAIISVW